MATERFFAVKIEVLTEEDGVAYLNKPVNTRFSSVESMPVHKACDQYGRDRVADLLLAALDRVRSHGAK